jgi:hypothetical protein
MNLYTLKHFFIGMQRNNIKKKKTSSAPKHTGNIQKDHQKNKERTPEKTQKTEETPNPTT